MTDSLTYDYINDDGEKIRKVSKQVGPDEWTSHEINLTTLFERPGARKTANPEILRIEKDIGRENLGNPAIPLGDPEEMAEWVAEVRGDE